MKICDWLQEIELESVSASIQDLIEDTIYNRVFSPRAKRLTIFLTNSISI